MEQLTADDIACSALAADDAHEVGACYQACNDQGRSFHMVAVTHPRTGQRVSLSLILADAFLALAPKRRCPGCARGVHTCDGIWPPKEWGLSGKCGCVYCAPQGVK